MSTPFFDFFRLFSAFISFLYFVTAQSRIFTALSILLTAYKKVPAHLESIDSYICQHFYILLFTFYFFIALLHVFLLLKILPTQIYLLHGRLFFQDILLPSANPLPALQHLHFHESSAQALF